MCEIMYGLYHIEEDFQRAEIYRCLSNLWLQVDF